METFDIEFYQVKKYFVLQSQLEPMKNIYNRNGKGVLNLIIAPTK